MHTPLCEASGPMLAQQYCSCMAVVYTFAKFASALVNFSYKFVDGNTTFNDRPLTDLKIKCVQS